MKTTTALSTLISRLARNLDIDALLDSSVALSTLKLRLAVDARLAQLLLFSLHNLTSFSPKIVHISSLNPMNIF